MYYAGGTPGWMRFGGYGSPYGYPYGASYEYPAQSPMPDAEIEKKALKSQFEALQSEMDLIKRRLSEIEGEAAAQ